jgi:mono/diheme cytochrome c family protein
LIKGCKALTPYQIMVKQIVVLLIAVFTSACATDYPETEISFSDYQYPDDIRLEAVAAEPLIQAPVDISFDDQGRLWVLEMTGYMRSLSGMNEDDPVGRIVVMQDRDEDGVADHEAVFLDSLVLARAISHVYGGLLYAEPPELWFVEINDDLTPGARTLVDPRYAVGGNVEHQPNGLLLNVDNWIYNAKDDKRYRRVDGQWVMEKTYYRGQWGITHDPMGRLLYNTNSNQLRGDFVLPNMLHRNQAFQSELLLDQEVVEDQRVYPLQPTPVNRGYQEGTLDTEGKLVEVTAASGPVLFEGANLPSQYNTNAFVPMPEVNLVKRNIVDLDRLSLVGRQAWEGREFIISSDMGFRPVNLKNGPDGALYVVDMRRGIIQHKTYMTAYLRERYIETGLDTLMGTGRIIRVAGAEAPPFREIDLTALTPMQWIDSLSSRNTWIRNRAQHLLHQSDDPEVTERLRERMMSSPDEIFRIHALYAQEGKGVWDDLAFDFSGLEDQDRFRTHVLKLAAEDQITISGLPEDVASVDSTSAIYLMYYAARKGDVALVDQLRSNYDDGEWILEPLFSAYEGDPGLLGEGPHVERIRELNVQREEILARAERPVDTESLSALQLFQQNCTVCHGPDGEGIRDLAPPLLNSEYVSGSPERLASILLYGVTGPITVNGVEYEFANAMPGLVFNNELSDEDIAGIMSFIRNAYASPSIREGVPAELVEQVRSRSRPGNAPYSEEELLNYQDEFGDDRGRSRAN